MASKNAGYIIGGLQILAGAVLTIFGAGALGVPLMISGAASIAGTALLQPPNMARGVSRSAHYGFDTFNNPRAIETPINVFYGERDVVPAVLMEAATSTAEAAGPGVDPQRKQGLRWLGAVAEGPNIEIDNVEVNDVPLFSDLNEGKEIGKGNGTKKVFEFPERWVWLGTDDAPAVQVWVAGTLKSFSTKSTMKEFVVPTKPAPQKDSATGLMLPIPPYVIFLKRDLRPERILPGSITMTIRGTGHPEAEQPRRTGTYKWSAQRVTRWKVRVVFEEWPPAGFTVKVAYDYLTTENLAIGQTRKGVTKLFFGTAPANNAKITATYRTTPFAGLRVDTRPGDLDQQPIDGFTDSWQSNPVTGNTVLLKDPGDFTKAVTYDTRGREVDDLRINLVAPQGFVQYKDDGGTAPVDAKVRIEYRKTGTSSWTRLRNENGDTFYLQEQKDGRTAWEVSIIEEWRKLLDSDPTDTAAGDAFEAFERGAYDVRVYRTTAVSTDTLVRHRIEMPFVTEVLREGFTYPGTSLLALELVANQLVSGSSIRVRCRARKAWVRDPRMRIEDRAYLRDLNSSQNPALAILDLVTSGGNQWQERYGGGFFFTDEDLFIGTESVDPDDALNYVGEKNSLIAFADWCDEWVYRPGDSTARPAYATGNGERRCRLNLVLDTPQSLQEAVANIAFLGFCFASLQGARWRFPLDQDGDSVYTFADDVDPPNQNADDFTLDLESWTKTPTHVLVRFFNELFKYSQDELLHPVSDLAAGRQQNISAATLLGCTRETEAARMGQHLAEQANATPFPCTWTAMPSTMRVEAGDIVTFRTRVPYSTGQDAMELMIRVLQVVVERGDKGKLQTRFSGRVLKSDPYRLPTATLPPKSVELKSAPPATGSSGSTSQLKKPVGVKVVKDLTATVLA